MAISHLALTTSTWRFSRADGLVGTETMQFLPDGQIGGYSNPNEQAWRIEDGGLVLLDAQGVTTSRFELPQEGKGRLEGIFLPDPSIRLLLERTSTWPQFPANTRVSLAREIAAYQWPIGEHTYGAPMVLEPRDAQLRIGRYTSIGPNVMICLSNHDTANVSSYPFVALQEYWPGVAPGMTDHAAKGDVSIGHDVWIGAHAFICPGVCIGDGAVIASYSVVTKNVSAYEIAGGNPARRLRSRFPAAIVSRLQRVAWWDWGEETINALLPLMMSHDIERFLDEAERRIAAAERRI